MIGPKEFVVTVADILAALDIAIMETRERARICEETQRHDEAEFADNIQSGLTAFREYIRSQDFFVQCQNKKEIRPS